jgi:hypothetical protein
MKYFEPLYNQINKNFSKNQIKRLYLRHFREWSPRILLDERLCLSKTLFECENSFTFNVNAIARPMNDPFRPTAMDGFNIEPSYQGNVNHHVELERAMLY